MGLFNKTAETKKPLKDIEIKIAYYSFNCFCGERVKKGSNYINVNGFKMCIKHT